MELYQREIPLRKGIKKVLLFGIVECMDAHSPTANGVHSWRFCLGLLYWVDKPLNLEMPCEIDGDRLNLAR